MRWKPSPSRKRRRKMLMVAERDGGWTCRYCGRTLTQARLKKPVGTGENDPTLDHVVPRIRGGTSELHNLVLACRRCNSTKSDRSEP